jgi:subtilisin family serine protease
MARPPSTLSNAGRRLALILTMGALACDGSAIDLDLEAGAGSSPLTAERVIYESLFATHGTDVVDDWRHLDDDADPFVRAALGIEELEDMSLHAGIESHVYERGGTDTLSGDLVHASRVVVEPRVVLSVEERAEIVDELEEIGELNADEADEMRARLADRISAIQPPVLSARALLELEGAPASDLLPVEVCGAPIEKAQLPEHALLHEILYGFDREAAKESLAPLRTARQERAADAQELLIQHLPSGIDLTPSADRPCVRVSLTKAQIQELALTADVTKIYLGAELRAEGTVFMADGKVTREAVQAEYFRLQNDIGGAAPSKSNSFSRLTAAVCDSGFNDNHRALKDNSSATRVYRRYHCYSATSACTQVSDIDSEGSNHGMSVVGVLAGDLVDGQDANFSTERSRQTRSGVAGEVGLVLMNGNLDRAADQARADAVDVMNYSIGPLGLECPGRVPHRFTEDGKCRGGPTAVKDALNLAHDDGIFIVYSAGNDFEADSLCTCTVNEPADAEGVFPVAALSNACSESNHAVVRAAVRPAYSSEGGGELGGFISTTRERTLIGMAAPTTHDLMAYCDPGTGGTCDTADLSQYGCTSGGTSFAAPVVTAAAIAFKDRWMSYGNPATWLDDAGNMRIQMLLMGDRVSNDGTTKMQTRYSTMYGAGRLKMRHLSEPGMDAPWARQSGKVVLWDGNVYTRWVSLNGSPQVIDADVDALVVVAWWFEPETVSAAANIMMRLERYTGSTCGTYQSALFDSSFDTRKRIYSSGAGGSCFRIRFDALDIPYSAAEGGAKRRLYWGWYYEDTDRDDVDGPTLHSPIQRLDVELP